MTETFLQADSGEATPVDDERVVLIKSLATNNRFYALVSRDSGIGNAETIEEIPHELLLGIAYPCLEDGLNDFAVIRTTYETLELFADDEEMRGELLEIIHDARRNLIWRLMELLERIIAHKAYFLGTDLEAFKASAVKLMRQGFPRRTLDGIMKVNVFSSVGAGSKTAQSGFAVAEGDTDVYRYEFHNTESFARLITLPGHEFLLSLFSDVLDSVLEDDNYQSKYTFDRHVFQQFIALMFASYAATDSVFYGTHKDDYGISREKSMDNTPLYVSIKRELRRIASGSLTLTAGAPGGKAPPENSAATGPEAGRLEAKSPADEAMAAGEPAHAEAENTAAPATDYFAQTEDGDEEMGVHLSDPLANEDALLPPIASIRALAMQLQKHYRGDSAELSRLILAEVSRLVEELKRLGIISPLAYNPDVPAPRRVDTHSPILESLSENEPDSAP